MCPNPVLLDPLVFRSASDSLVTLERLWHWLDSGTAGRLRLTTLQGNLWFDWNYGIAIVRKLQDASDPWHDDVSKSGARLSWPSAREIREFVDGVDGLAGTCASL